MADESAGLVADCCKVIGQRQEEYGPLTTAVVENSLDANGLN